MNNVVTRAILLNDRGEVLVGRRVRGGGAGKWALIGGKPDGDETMEQAVVREVKEEIGVDFEPHFFRKIEDRLSSDRAEDETGAWDMYIYYSTYQGDLHFQEEEISEVKFVSKDDLETCELAFNHKEILQDFFTQTR